jgi:hypothetical protein
VGGAVNFSQQDRWFGDLSRRKQRRIHALGAEAAERTAGARLLPASHGEELDAQLDAAVAAFSAQEDPFCLVRVSDSELGLVGAGYLPPATPMDIDWYRFRGGMGDGALALREPYLEAIRNAELVGLQQNWKPITEASATLLGMLGIDLPMSNGVEVHLPYRLLVDGTLFEYLAGKRVLLIGWLAPKLAAAWRTRPFLETYGVWGPVAQTQVVGVIPTASRTEGGAAQNYAAVLARLAEFDFDVALLACGVAAKPLAWEIRKRGRTALDVGFVFNALLDDEQRSERPVFRDVAWPA